MTDARTETYTFRRVEASDEQAVLEMLRVSLGDAPVEGYPPDFFRWKHHENPFGSSFMLLAESEGAIAGLRAFLRWRFVVDGRSVRGVRAVDTATHPAHQGRGVFSRLTRAALDALRDEADMVFNTPNEKSLPGYLKLGWTTVGTVPVSIRVRRPVRFIRGYRASRGPLALPAAVDAGSVHEALADEGRVDELLAAVNADPASASGLRTDRSSAYLRWRYGDIPGVEYHALRHEEGGVLRGLAIFRVRARRGLVETTLVEVLVPPGDRRTAAALLRGVRRAAPSDHLMGHFWPGSTTASVSARAGFVRTRGGPVFVVNPLASVHPDPTSMGSWRLSVGDLELF